jgi:mono/diheme cytochrome c family protein
MVLRAFILLIGVAAFTSCDHIDAPQSSTENNPHQITAVEPTQLFLQHCEACHGMNGDKGVSNAANLKQSIMIDMQIKKIIQDGSASGMPSFRDKLTEPEILALIEYVKILRTR